MTIAWTVSRGLRVWTAICALFAASCGDEPPREPPPGACAAVVGRWELRDDNLFMEVATGCVIANFCSIREGIHTRGTITDSELELDSVGGSPTTFSYTLSGETLTIMDGNGTTDLPLTRRTEALPSNCPPPA